MQIGHFLIWRRVQMNRRVALRTRSATKLSTAAPRRSRKEWPATFRGTYPQVIRVEVDAKSPIAAFRAKQHGCDAKRGGSNVCADPLENCNGVSQGSNGNESPGESIGLPRKHRGGFRPLRSASCAAQRAGRADDSNRKRRRDLRNCQMAVDAPRFAEEVGACVSWNRGSLWRFESQFSCQLTNQVPFSRRSEGARISTAADLRRVAECSQCVHLIAVGFVGPSEPTGLLPPLRSILRQYRVIVYANSLRDPDARVRNLPATSVSTREGTERAQVCHAYSSSNRAAPPETVGVGLSSGG